MPQRVQQVDIVRDRDVLRREAGAAGGERGNVPAPGGAQVRPRPRCADEPALCETDVGERDGGGLEGHQGEGRQREMPCTLHQRWEGGLEGMSTIGNLAGSNRVLRFLSGFRNVFHLDNRHFESSSISISSCWDQQHARF